MTDRPWLRLAIGNAAAMLLAMGLGRFSFTAMVPLLVQTEQYTKQETGWIGCFNLLGFLLGAIFTNYLRRSLRLRVLLQSALWLSFTALLVCAFPVGFIWLAILRGILGITVGIIMVLSLALTTTVIPRKYQLCGAVIVFFGVGLGIAFSGAIVPVVLESGVSTVWMMIASFGFLALLLALWGCCGIDDTAFPSGGIKIDWKKQAPLVRLLFAHACFAVGLVPHTLYWVEYVAHGLQRGTETAEFYWAVSGFFAMVGPIIVWLAARRLKIVRGLVFAFTSLALFIAAPGLYAGDFVIVASTVVFGAQPALSALIAIRARELRGQARMPEVMQKMIFFNAGAAGLACWLFPYLLAGFGYEVLFIIGGLAMAFGALLAFPWREASPNRAIST
ncbi:MAG: YbfB/YjiJ family MFS transporter [Proteobacteria bacterium]|nr:YbfB/YjiJ family MFS transporter [Pseudomonadota bacterium]